MRALPQTHSVKQFKLFTLSSADEEEYFQKTAPLNKGRFMQYNLKMFPREHSHFSWSEERKNAHSLFIGRLWLCFMLSKTCPSILLFKF